MSDPIETLGDGIQREVRRNQVLVFEYEKLGPSGKFAATMIGFDIDAALQAMAEEDCVAMIAAFKELEGNE
jgi:hypothetical protein